MTDFAKQLREIRREKRISQEALAMSLGLGANSGPVISRLETRAQATQIETVIRWADALGYRLTLEPKE